MLEKCHEGEWEEQDAIDFFNEADELYNAVEKYSYVNNVDMDSLVDLDLLNQIIDVFDQFTNDWDEDEETMDLTFPENLSEALNNLESE